MSVPGSPQPMLVVKDLTVSYHRVPAIHHISFSLDPGHCVGIFGPNGAGKSTLLKAVAGLLIAETGKILIEEQDLSKAATLLAYLPQRESVDWDFPVTVRGLVEMGRYPHVGILRPFSRHDDEAVTRAMELFDLLPLANRQIKELSGGQQQRAFLARAWAQEADLYLLDEPFSGLDRGNAATLSNALRKLKELGKLVLVSHHALAEADSLFDSAILLNGELIACGPTARVMTPQNRECAYGTAIFSGAHSHTRA